MSTAVLPNIGAMVEVIGNGLLTRRGVVVWSGVRPVTGVWVDFDGVRHFFQPGQFHEVTEFQVERTDAYGRRI